jgi:site-specific recombinase XerD
MRTGYLAAPSDLVAPAAKIVECALKKAGIESARKGAHLLRHSLATDMLRKGATLEEIGEVLRHKSPDSTAIYAKVELDALKPRMSMEILMHSAQFWMI